MNIGGKPSFPNLRGLSHTATRTPPSTGTDGRASTATAVALGLQVRTSASGSVPPRIGLPEPPEGYENPTNFVRLTHEQVQNLRAQQPEGPMPSEMSPRDMLIAKAELKADRRLLNQSPPVSTEAPQAPTSQQVDPALAEAADKFTSADASIKDRMMAWKKIAASASGDCTGLPAPFGQIVADGLKAADPKQVPAMLKALTRLKLGTAATASLAAHTPEAFRALAGDTEQGRTLSRFLREEMSKPQLDTNIRRDFLDHAAEVDQAVLGNSTLRASWNATVLQTLKTGVKVEGLLPSTIASNDSSRNYLEKMLDHIA
jgi:hypothetical protein